MEFPRHLIVSASKPELKASIFDLRHEATSRLFELGTLGIMEVTSITGHKDIKM